MNIEEFTKRTGFYPMLDEYVEIEKAYSDFSGDKDSFCKAFVTGNREWEVYRSRAKKITELNCRIEKMEEQFRKTLKQQELLIAKLERNLNMEQEWKPYESDCNVSQENYRNLAKDAESGNGAYYMTDEEATAWVCNEFDFAPSKVKIIHEIDEYEVNRHHQLRKTGRKIDRRPIYCATDYHYIRFNTMHFYYEAWNDNLRPFFD